MAAPVAIVAGTVEAAPPRRPRVLVIGTVLVSLAASMLFVGLLSIYVSLRQDAVAEAVASARVDEEVLAEQEGRDPEHLQGIDLDQDGIWFPSGTNIPLMQPNMAFATIGLSALTLLWALDAINRGARLQSYWAFGSTLLLGLAFVNITVFMWIGMEMPFAANDASVLVYTIGGAHVFMVACGLIWIAVAAFRALGGQHEKTNLETTLAPTIFWFATVGIFSVIWYAIYIIK